MGCLYYFSDLRSYSTKIKMFFITCKEKVNQDYYLIFERIWNLKIKYNHLYLPFRNYFEKQTYCHNTYYKLIVFDLMEF